MDRRNAGGEIRLTGIGLLLFAVLVLVALYGLLRPGEHPLAGHRDVPLCGLLPPAAWTQLVPTGQGVVVRTVGEGRSICELVAESSPDGPPGFDQPLARTMLTTEADMRYQSPGNSLDRHVSLFVSELKADDWTPVEIQGPWLRTYAFTRDTGEATLLIEDEGIFLLISSPGIPLERLQEFALEVTALLREVSFHDADHAEEPHSG